MVLAGEEASIDGPGIFNGLEGARCRCRRERWCIVSHGGCAVRDRGEHSDQVAGSPPSNRQRRAWADGWPQAAENCGRASGLAARPVSFWCLHPAWTGRRAGPARSGRRLPVGLGVRPFRGPQLQKKPSWPANKIDPMSRGGAGSGAYISNGLTLLAWFSSTRRGPRQTWRRYGDGHRLANGCQARCRMATGTR